MATLPTYERPLVSTLLERVGEPRRFMQVVVGPRQSGKTTAISQMLSKVDLPHHMVRASQDIVDSQAWLRREWDQARLLAGKDGHAILVIDEVQMVRQWSSVVKALWDADTDADLDLQVVLTGSSSLLLRKGLTEGLTGRFELISCNQWDYPECRDAFGYTLDDYLFFGGYPGAASLRGDEGRWLGYMTNSVIAPSVTRDVVSLEAVHKPAVMERLFSLGAAYSAQELSYRKILGQLDDAGNTTTIAHYLELLSNAGLLTGLQKYSEKLLRTRASSPRLMVHDTSLMVASYGMYRDFLLTDPERRGHLVESAVGAYLLRRSFAEGFQVFWWREGTDEVDFVVQQGMSRTAIEVKSGRVKGLGGLDVFCGRYPGTRSLVIGSADAPLEAFLSGEVPFL
ncbi:MAG: ATP-binding protein [Atopobiaceae bacterium]|nr:ATP-binding protein [Atopobiaceae bacterium]MCI2173789.1 ATP-binding protein [Atopobiaceae bacterium]MCI2207569.1 ATP-binding protein [Atopobiaceae bacterium]